MYDIVFPKENEKAFIDMGKKLGYSGLCFAYNEKLPEKKQKDDGFKVFYALVTENVSKARKYADFVILKNPENSRKHVEKFQPDVIFGVEMSNRKDFIHQRNSGVDHVICGLAKKKGVGFGFSVKDIIDSKIQPKIVGRIMQNITLFEKYGVDLFLASFAEHPLEMKNPYDIISLFAFLGVKNPKRCLSLIPEKITKNIKTKKGEMACGVEVVE